MTSNPTADQRGDAEAPATRLIDTHAHIISGDLGRYPPAPLSGPVATEIFENPFDVDTLLADMETSGVTHACLVQRAFVYGYDNRYVLDAAQPYSDRLVPIVMLRADDPNSPAQLEKLAAAHRLGGLRLAGGPTDLTTSWLDSPAALHTWRTAADLALPVAVFSPARQLGQTLSALPLIADRFPDLPIILDHLAIDHAADRTPGGNTISPQLRALRAFRNIHLKLTSLNIDRLQASATDIAHFVRQIVDEFGSDRLLWGSDSAQSQGPYARLAAVGRNALGMLSASELRDVSHGTAARLYRF